MGEVRLETADGILTVTLAEVESRNALGATILNGLHDAITEANADPAIRAVVVTNEGTTFCAGANLNRRPAPPRVICRSWASKRCSPRSSARPRPSLERSRGTSWAAATAWLPQWTSRSPRTT